MPPRSRVLPAALIVLGIAACSEESSRPAVPVAVVVQPRYVEAAAGETVAFGASVAGVRDQAVAWVVLDGPEFGTITPQGLFTAPSVVPEPPRSLIRACSLADTTVVDTAVVFLRAGASPVSVEIDPGSATVSAGNSRRFAAVVSGTGNPAVVWTVEGGPAHGSVTAEGVYTAPAVLPDPPEAVLVASSAADPAARAVVVVALIPAPDPAVAAAVEHTFNAGYWGAVASDQAVALVLQAQRLVGSSHPGAPAPTGTLTHTGGSWDYRPDLPEDHLLIQPELGAPIELWFEESGSFPLEGDFVGERGFLFQGTFEVRIVVEGSIDLVLRDESEPRSDTNALADICSSILYRRTLSGRFQAGGASWEILAVHTGEAALCSGGLETEEHIAGWLSRAGLRVDFVETISLASGGNYGGPGPFRGFTDWSSNLEATGRGEWGTYGFRNTAIAGSYRSSSPAVYGTVEDPDRWIAQGQLRRDREPYGTVRFEGPVLAGTDGEDAVLDYHGGERLLLWATGRPERPGLIPRIGF